MANVCTKAIVLGYFVLVVGSSPLVGQLSQRTGGRALPAEMTGSVRVHAFQLSKVRLLAGPLKDAMERNRQYLLSLDVDRLVHNFRVQAGLPSNVEPLGGWEAPNCELRGHFTGHFLSACALMYAATGEERLKSKAWQAVDALAKCQEVLGPDGYLSAYPEEFIDRVETGKRVWAPWYTLHKIYQGLIDVYTLTDNQQALDVVKKMASWARKRTDRLSDEQMQKMLRVEFGGMSESLFNLYAITGDTSHRALAKRFEKRSFLDPLRDHTDKLKGLHVNTHIPQVIGAARGYEMTAEEGYRAISNYFWNQLVHARSYATGGTSNGEHWGSEPYQLSTQLGSNTEESCCSYNMLKLTSHLFSWDPDPRFIDYYERTFINSIWPTQHPKTGLLMYYKPLGSGWYKTYGTALNSFWCCTGTGVESFARLGGEIYYHDENSLYVNLFVPSEVTWAEKGVTLRQETSFPESPTTRITVRTSKPTRWSLRIRVPAWNSRDAQVRVNGKLLDVSSSPSSYLTLTRTWKDGDTVEMEYSMDLHLHRMPDSPKIAAIMYGPLVLAGKLGGEGLADSLIFGSYGPTQPPVLSPILVADDRNLKSWIDAVPGRPLTFRTKGVGDPNDVELVPLHLLPDERYAVYWSFFDQDEWRRARQESAELVGKVIDHVVIGDSVSERTHNFVGNEVQSGADGGTHWVTTRDWFSYSMKVLIDRPVILKYSYTKADTGRSYNISVDEIRLSTKPTVRELPNEMIEEEHEIPLPMTRGRRTVIVSFQSRRWFEGKKILSCEIVGSAKGN